MFFFVLFSCLFSVRALSLCCIESEVATFLLHSNWNYFSFTMCTHWASLKIKSYVNGNFFASCSQSLLPDINMQCQTNLFGLFAAHMYPIPIYASNIIEQAKKSASKYLNKYYYYSEKTTKMDRENMAVVKINKHQLSNTIKCNERVRTTTKKFVVKICRPRSKVRAQNCVQ